MARVLTPGGLTPKPVFSQPQCTGASQVSLTPSSRNQSSGPDRQCGPPLATQLASGRARIRTRFPGPAMPGGPAQDLPWEYGSSHSRFSVTTKKQRLTQTDMRVT